MAKQCQSEQTVQRHTALENSLLKLLRTESFSDISVKDICQDAAIPRRTFYHYFTGKDDLMDSLISDLFLECDLAIMPDFASGIKAADQSLTRFFRFWGHTRRGTLELLLRSGQADSIIRHALLWARQEHSALPQDHDPAFSQWVLISAISGFFAMLFHWVRTGCRESAEEMASHVLRYLSEPLLKL